MIAPAKRIAGVEEYYYSAKLRQIAQWQAEGREIINLGIGSPDMAPASSIVEVLTHGVQQAGNHG